MNKFLTFYFVFLFFGFQCFSQIRIPLPKTDSLLRQLDSVPIEKDVQESFLRLDSINNKIFVKNEKLTPFKTFIKKEGKLRNQKAFTPNVIAFEFFFGLLFLGIIVYFKPGFIGYLLSLLWNRKSLNEFYENNSFGFGFLNILLDAIFIIALALGAAMFSKETGNLNLLWYLIFSAGYYYVRILFIQLIGWIFTRNDTAYEHLFLWLVWSRALGVGMFIFLFLSYLQPFIFSGYLGIGILSLFFVLGVFWFFTLLRSKEYKTVWEGAYFFLYLCTVEFSPVLIISRDFIQ